MCNSIICLQPSSSMKKIFRTGKPTRDDFNFQSLNSWFNRFVESSNPLYRKSWWETLSIDVCFNRKIYTSTPYAGVAGILRNKNHEEFAIGRLNSSCCRKVLFSTDPACQFLTIGHETDLPWTVVSIISSCIWYTRASLSWHYFFVTCLWLAYINFWDNFHNILAIIVHGIALTRTNGWTNERYVFLCIYYHILLWGEATIVRE